MDQQFRIYIAGPHRAVNYWLMEQNARMAEGYSLAVWQAGHVPVCPHTQIRNYHDALPGDVLDRGMLTMLDGCHAVLVIPGWERSAGTRADIDHAERRGIPVEHALTTNIRLHVENIVRRLRAMEEAACISH